MSRVEWRGSVFIVNPPPPREWAGMYGEEDTWAWYADVESPSARRVEGGCGCWDQCGYRQLRGGEAGAEDEDEGAGRPQGLFVTPVVDWRIRRGLKPEPSQKQPAREQNEAIGLESAIYPHFRRATKNGEMILIRFAERVLWDDARQDQHGAHHLVFPFFLAPAPSSTMHFEDGSAAAASVLCAHQGPSAAKSRRAHIQKLTKKEGRVSKSEGWMRDDARSGEAKHTGSRRKPRAIPAPRGHGERSAKEARWA
ncbi:hypothetical protein C8R45DRAFT_921344 [Mycena sanguinolenta]|nr:hypothetical protein C8R45DRAFT_921344 [Mycena sanguinolenta]